MTALPSLTVFISYSHDTTDHAARVLALADRLRSDGIDCQLDQYVAAPAEGWPRWTERQIDKAEFVLMVCTPTYYRRFAGEETPGTGQGVRWEGHLVYQLFYNADTVNQKFIPVLLGGANPSDIPTPFRGFQHYRPETPDGYEQLCRHLTGQPATPPPPVGTPVQLPPRPRKGSGPANPPGGPAANP